MPIPKKFLPLIIAIASALLATFLVNIVIKEAVKRKEKEFDLMQKNLTTVVVARQDIQAGTVIKENMLSEEKLNKRMLQPRAATSIDRVADRIAIAPISKGEQILLNKLTISGEETSLSMKIPKGKRAITIAVDNISSVGGMIRPGDHVDLVGIVPLPAMTAEGKQVMQPSPLTLFQDVLVLAVGQVFTSVAGAKKEEKVIYPTVTLALSSQETNLVAFVQEQGKIRLVLRSPGDTQVEPATPATWDTLFRTIMPQAYQEKPVEIKPRRTVEIYRGLQREERALE